MASTTRPHYYYEILQIPPDADLKAIRLNWKRLARVKHPDKNPAKNATAKFQLLEKAYSTLSDPEARQIYDAKYRAHTITSSTRHSTRQTDSEEGPYKNQPILLEELFEKLKMWANRLSEEEQKLRDIRKSLTMLESDIYTLQMEILTMEHDTVSGQTIWGYLDTFLPGGGNRQEQQKQEQDRFYRDKIAAIKIKEMDKTRRQEVIQTYETNIRSFRQQLYSTEYAIRSMEEKDLRDQEERAKMAEQKKREERSKMADQKESEGWAYASWSATQSHAKGAPNQRTANIESIGIRSKVAFDVAAALRTLGACFPVSRV
ncbi:hypothetical protein N7486_010519 [Penicillium sp. IBT 16267x]|nr:hypothetical protein N7486_010519 [Penicillium sp. IBT 16267x]